MSKKIFFVLLMFFFFLSSFQLAFAGVIFNEIQLSPTDNRFIELYNSGSSSINLTDWYIQRKTASGSSFSSLVTKTDFDKKIIDANSYFLISKTSQENSDIIIGDLTLTESNAIQIKDSDGNVVDKIAWGGSNECNGSCPANPTDGKSLQRISDGSWKVANPTPSAQNYSILNTNTVENNNSNTNNTVAPVTSTVKTKTEIPSIKTKIIANNIAYANLPFLFQSNNLGYSGELLNYGKVFWNFGDGSTKEQVNNFDKFYHMYSYPGKYNVYLEYYSNSYGDTPNATNKTTIEVIPLTVTISKVGDEKDFFIELSNDGDHEVDISKWILSSLNKNFVLPKNTIISSKDKIILSSKVTNFILADKDSLRLLLPTNEVVFNYTSSFSDSNPNLSKININTKPINRLISTNLNNIDNNIVKNEITDNTTNNDLTASISDSEVVKEGDSYLFFIGFAILLTVSAFAVYFIRRKKVNPQEGDDFEILDE
ncbi:MAG: lamin tail domain-containing protein [bacterium]